MNRQWRNRLVAFIITMLLAFGLNYLLLPAWTLRSTGLWVYFIIVGIIAIIVFAIAEFAVNNHKGKADYKCTLGTGVILAVWFIIFVVSSVASGTIFRAKTYSSLVTVSDGVFAKDVVKNDNPEDIPIIDQETAKKLGDRTMGVMSDQLSQFEVNDEYNLINYQGKSYRVSPLEYGGFWKYQNSKHSGIPGYVLVDNITGESELVELEQKIKFSPSAFFGDKLGRHLRKRYPSKIFEKAHFEIDEEGSPYYIIPTSTPAIGLFKGKVVNEVILLNAATGDTEIYDKSEVPNWVDHVYSVDYILERMEWWGKYQNGFWNSVFSKKSVKYTTDHYIKNDEDEEEVLRGYNTLANEDGIFLYTGITSAGKDESNIGFILANLRTAEIKFYLCAGAKETSAQSAAEGLVQQYKYKAGYPIVINVDGVETYFMTLKDGAQLTKKVALVNMKQYTICVEADTMTEAVSKYKAKLNSDSTVKTEEVEAKSKKGKVSEIYSAIIEGNTYYYYKLENDSNLYMSSIVNSNLQVALKVGDTISIEFKEGTETGLQLVTKIETVR